MRTELGEEVINRMIADGTIISRPAQEDEEAMRLLRLLSIVSRRRWPEFADAAPPIGVPPPKKKAAVRPRQTTPSRRLTQTTEVDVAGGRDRARGRLELVERGLRLAGPGGSSSAPSANSAMLVLGVGLDLGAHARLDAVAHFERVDHVERDAAGARRRVAGGEPPTACEHDEAASGPDENSSASTRLTPQWPILYRRRP